MVFKRKEAWIESGRDCKDFMQTKWSKRHCINSQQCDYLSQGYKDEECGDNEFCTGVKE